MNGEATGSMLILRMDVGHCVNGLRMQKGCKVRGIGAVEAMPKELVVLILIIESKNYCIILIFLKLVL